MPLFRRKKEAADAGDPNGEKEKKRPANTAFKQQRLKAWQPILTPKTVLPTLFIIGILFAPIGGLLVWGSGLVTELTINYTDCDSVTPSSADNLQFASIPSSSYSYRLRSSNSSAQFNPPTYAFVNDTSLSPPNPQCIIQFDIPYDIQPTVLLYYRLTNFFQNHRRYVQSYDADQLLGRNRTVSNLRNGNCKPVAVDGDKVVYPCGLIANSQFNDTISNLTMVNPPAGASTTYNFNKQGIAWPNEHRKYATSPTYAPSEITPPPNWALRFPQGYNSTNIPNFAADEDFQNWMRTAGLPTFSKLYGRNDDTPLLHGTYRTTVNMNFPVKPYSGTKSIVISTVSWIGGKNPFLGWAYVAAASLFVALAIAGTIRHLVKPRRLGDMSLLSWNRT
ncbi:cell cycle control protein [Vararia minispora EC-137]|uniref:Cell cycle control protein n=1 Tax=Vararia minispora EC-137 TaxID=1314806 RepID=A0ACB8QGV6_9AGAM|nr:cell cycle control protein [Vararia minispora EC-137]